MFWLGVLGFVVAWAIAVLAWACCVMAKEGDEAFEELNESIRELRQVAQSVAGTSGRSAQLVRRRAQPMRRLLEGIGDDIITQPFKYRDGCMHVPQGPGLGVELDEDKIEKYHRHYKHQGSVNEFLDPHRPEWVPNLPLF